MKTVSDLSVNMTHQSVVPIEDLMLIETVCEQGMGLVVNTHTERNWIQINEEDCKGSTKHRGGEGRGGTIWSAHHSSSGSVKVTENELAPNQSASSMLQTIKAPVST